MGKSIKPLQVILFLVLIAVISSFGNTAQAQQVCFTGVEDEYGNMLPMSSYEDWYEHQYKMYKMGDGLSCEKLQSYKDLADGVIESLEVVETVIKNNKKWTKVKLIVTTVKTGTLGLKVWLADLPCDVENVEKEVTGTICASGQFTQANISCRNVNSSDDVLNIDWLNGTSPQNMCMPEGSYNL